MVTNWGSVIATQLIEITTVLSESDIESTYHRREEEFQHIMRTGIKPMTTSADHLVPPRPKKPTIQEGVEQPIITSTNAAPKPTVIIVDTTPIEIHTNNDLKIGQHYHCFSRLSGNHQIIRASHSEGFIYLCSDGLLLNRFYVDRGTKKPLDIWRIYTVTTPKLTKLESVSIQETPKRIRLDSDVTYTVSGEEVSKEEYDAYVRDGTLSPSEEQFWKDVFIAIVPNRNASTAALEATKSVKEYREFKATGGN